MLWIQISLLVLILIIIVGLNMQVVHAFFVKKYLETLKRGHLTIYDYNSRLILDINKSNE